MNPKRVLVALNLLILAALACSLQGAPEPIIVTATPIGGIPTQGPLIITATPEFVPTLAPVPTATLVPGEGIRRANLALRNGDYERAVLVYQAVLDDALLGDDLRAEAAVRLNPGLYPMPCTLKPCSM